MPKYVLPELPYDVAALEPHLSAKILELHHDKHHAAYVKGANDTLDQLEEARRSKNFASITLLEKKLAFHLSGHVLHSLYWQNLMPKGGGRPGGELATALNRDFGSFELFQEQLVAAAANIMGSGWAALVYEPMAKRLATVQIHDHQSDIAQGGVPLMVIDAWEHAWYLQYQTDKAKYFQALWNLWNWQDIGRRFELAQKLDLGLQRTVG